MKLFKLVDYELRISDEAYGLIPFAQLISRDKSEGKTKARNELLFIYYFADPNSDFFFIKDEKQRMQDIVNNIGLPKNFKIDKYIQDAIDFYKTHSISELRLLLNDTYELIHKTRQAMKEMTINDADDMKKAIDVSEKIPSLMKKMKQAELEVDKENEEAEAMIGGREKTVTDDGFSNFI